LITDKQWNWFFIFAIWKTQVLLPSMLPYVQKKNIHKQLLYLWKNSLQKYDLNIMILALSNRWYETYLFIFCRIAPDDTVHYIDQCSYLKSFLKAYLRSDGGNCSSNSLLIQSMSLLYLVYFLLLDNDNSVVPASILLWLSNNK
jgi:hypothetical protein